MSSDQLPSADVLRTSLTALNLPIWGSREQMWERLKNGGEKKKPGPKPGKKNKDTSAGTLSTTSLFEPGELKFYNAERPKLLALGITDQKSRCTYRCGDEIHLRLQFSINRGLAMALGSLHHPLEGLTSPSAKQKPPVQSALIKKRLLHWD